MTWRDLWRRLVNALRPAPRTCPRCYDVGVTLTEWYAAHGLVSEWYRCDDCGHEWGGVS